eukprot:CAMPEP_0197852242 /NCGR_PEP_ID=MMETSP1438-20131217/20008_1 /TAXON_ID=1461541 /ORGANISM="Pterosperma sp., Strain CCMP1384" /LENGTH=141 /DNA_ID=CAMNT_0043466175 /DNA_START=127 /DNA_END=552 /DNA_ORIENTATION=+
MATAGWLKKTLPLGVVVTHLEMTTFGLKVKKNTSGPASGPTKLDTIPSDVQALMEEKQALDLYNELLVEVGKSPKDTLGNYLKREVQCLVSKFKAKFIEKGVNVFFCMKKDVYEEGWQTHKWLEFSDTTEQKEYFPPESQC